MRKRKAERIINNRSEEGRRSGQLKDNPLAESIAARHKQIRERSHALNPKVKKKSK